MHRKLLLIGVLLIVGLNIYIGIASATTAKWWNSTWNYRINLTVNTSSYNRTDWPVEFSVNFTKELGSQGVSGTFDANSTRIIEYNSTGGPMYEVSSQFDKRNDYLSTGNAFGDLVWILNGTRPVNSNYYFQIYFDILENGAKAPPDYSSSELTYSNNSDEFWLNNSLLELRTDTNRSSTSGMYFAKFKDGQLIFNSSPAQDTVESIGRLYNEFATQSYWYDLKDNFTLISNGSVRKIIELVGNEKIWATETQTNNFILKKRYTFYEGQQWIQIEQNLTNIGPDPIADYRKTIDPTALALDVDGAGLTCDSTNSNTTDPFSWYSCVDTSKTLGLAVINLNESGTGSYKAGYSNVLGIRLTGEDIEPNSSITETAIVYFVNGTSHDPVRDLRNRFESNVIITQGTPELWQVVVEAQTNSSVYNRNETALLKANVTIDTHALNSSATANLTDPSGNNLTFTLFDDGTNGDEFVGDGVYTNNYQFKNVDPNGTWTLTVWVYGEGGLLLNQSTKSFNLTDVYNVSVVMLPGYESVQVDDPVQANVSVRNYLGFVPINNASLSCNYTNQSGYSLTVPGNNITNYTGGFHILSFTAPSTEGIWTLGCTASKSNNTGYGETTFEITRTNFTNLSLDITNRTTTVSDVTWIDNQTFLMIVNVSNFGNGTSYSTNLTLVLHPNLSANITLESLGSMFKNTFKVRHFEITVLPRTPPGNYSLNVSLDWENYDTSIVPPLTRNETIVIVAENPKINVTPSKLDGSIGEGTEKFIGNLTVNSTGNFKIENITVICNSGALCNQSNFNVSFSPNFTALIQPGNFSNVLVNVTVADGISPGVYNGTVRLNSTGGWNDILLNVTVNESRTWDITLLDSCSDSVLINSSGDLCEVKIDNTGNVKLNFTVTPPGGNFTNSSVSNFSVPHGSTYNFFITYNTSDAALDNTYIANYTINATTVNASPDYSQVNVTMIVVQGPTVEIVYNPQLIQQTDNLTLIVNVTDRASGTIKNVTANITKPDNTSVLIALSNITANIAGTSSNWTINFTNTSLRGNYTIFVYSYDNKTGFGQSQEVNTTAKVKLVMVIDPGPSYKQGDSGEFTTNITDALGVPLEGVNVTIWVYEPGGVSPKYTRPSSPPGQTDVTGRLIESTEFSLTSNALKGTWTWVANASFYDLKADAVTNGSVTGSFIVTGPPLDVKVEVGDQYNPGDEVKVFAIIKDSNGQFLSGAAVNATITGTNLTVNITFTEASDNIYEGSYTLPNNVSIGTYRIVARATSGVDEGVDASTFSVVQKEAVFTLTVDVGSSYSPGQVAELYATLKTRYGDLVSGANVTANITLPGGNETQLVLQEVSGPAYQSNYSLDANASFGSYFISAEASYAGDKAFDAASFTVGGDLNVKVSAPPIVYINETLRISMLVVNPNTGDYITPDNLRLIIYHTEGSNYSVWQPQTNISNKSGDFYIFEKYLDPNDTNITTNFGSKLVIVEAAKGSTQVLDMESFRLLGKADVEIISTSVSGGTVSYVINVTNKGALTQDITVVYSIKDAETLEVIHSSSVPQSIDIPLDETRTFEGDYSGLSDGSYILSAQAYQNNVPISEEVSKTFTVGGAGGPGGPGGGPGGGGGGGGGEEEPEPIGAILNITEIYPPVMGVERGGTAYLTLTLENTGEEPLHDISTTLDGIPLSWFSLVKGEAEVLEAGESLIQIFKIDVPSDTTDQVFDINISSTSQESKDKKPVILRLFENVAELLDWEIERTREAMLEAEDKAFVALSEGRNVTRALALLREANDELRRTEDLVASFNYQEALQALENTRQRLREINSLIDQTKKPEIVTVTITPPPTTPAPTLPPTTPPPTPEPTAFPIKLIAAIAGSVIFIAAVFGLLFMRNISKKIDTIKTTKQTTPVFTSKRRITSPSSSNLQRKKEETQKLLETLKLQHTKKIISEKTYMELKKKNDERLTDIEAKMEMEAKMG